MASEVRFVWYIRTAQSAGLSSSGKVSSLLGQISTAVFSDASRAFKFTSFLAFEEYQLTSLTSSRWSHFNEFVRCGGGNAYLVSLRRCVYKTSSRYNVVLVQLIIRQPSTHTDKHTHTAHGQTHLHTRTHAHTHASALNQQSIKQLS